MWCAPVPLEEEGVLAQVPELGAHVRLQLHELEE